MKTVKYFDERLMMNKMEVNPTDSEVNSRVGDLRMMELGGHVSNISIITPKVDYILKGIPEELWKSAKKKAIDLNKTMKQVLLDALKKFVEKE